jgi:hypothetical protein
MAEPSQLAELPSLVDQFSKLAVPVIAFLGAIYTARQYWRAQRWRGGDLAASLVSQLETDDELAFACRVLDWGVGPLIVPERYRPLLEKIPEGTKNPTPTERGEVLQQDLGLMARALRVGLAIDPKNEPAGLIYRYCFDKLFNHLANVDRLLKAEQIKLEDIRGLQYWLKRIAAYEYPPAGMTKQEVFQPFVEYGPFGYRGIIDLGEKLGVTGWARGWEKRQPGK